MKKIAFISALALAAFAAWSFLPSHVPAPAATSELKWLSWQEAVELNKTKPKKWIVDVYTDWCGWCKHMDKTTFRDTAVARYLSENFYAVKLDAEMKEEITFNGHTFKFIAQGGRGVHELAYSLLDGKLGYPSVVYLTGDYERIMISPGFKPAEDLMKELKFTAEERYKTTTWDKYKAEN